MTRLVTRNQENSLYFNGGSTAAVRTSNFEPSGSAGATLSGAFWMKYGGDAVERSLISKFDYGTNNRSWAIFIEPNARFRVVVTSNGVINWKRYDSKTPISNSKCHLIGFTFSSNTLKLHMDENYDISVVKANDSTVDTIFQGNADVMIGSILNNNNIANPLLGEFNAGQLSSAAITQEEWLDYYYNNKDLPSLQANWLCQEGSGSTLADSSGYSRDGTILAGVNWTTNGAFKTRDAATARTTATNRTLATNRVII